MTERDYAKSLRRHWRLALACVALSVLAAVVYTATATPTYRATATMFVSIRIDEPGAAYQAGMFTQQRVQSYAEIVDSPSVMEAVIESLDLTLSPEDLASRVSAAAPIDTVLLEVSAEDTSAALAGDIANAVAASFADQVSELERAAGNEESPVEVSLVGPAGPGARTQPGAAVNVVLGVFIGAVIGFGATVLRDSLDRTVKAGELEERLGLPVLARIPGGNGMKRDAVIALARPRSRQAEEYRSLRTNLQFADIEDPPRSIVVTSAHEAEGKTTTLCNLAVVLAQAGNEVIVVSGDLRHPRLDELVGVHRHRGLTSVLAGQTSLDQALQRWGDPELPLWVLPSGPLPGNPSEVLGSKPMELLLRELEERAAFVLIDAPPVLPFTDAAVVSAAASGVLLVVRSGRTPYEEVSRAARALDAVGARVYGAVVTMTPRRGVDSSYSTSYRYDELGTTETPDQPRRAAPSGPSARSDRGRPDPAAPVPKGS